MYLNRIWATFLKKTLRKEKRSLPNRISRIFYWYGVLNSYFSPPNSENEENEASHPLTLWKLSNLWCNGFYTNGKGWKLKTNKKTPPRFELFWFMILPTYCRKSVNIKSQSAKTEENERVVKRHWKHLKPVRSREITRYRRGEAGSQYATGGDQERWSEYSKRERTRGSCWL